MVNILYQYKKNVTRDEERHAPFNKGLEADFAQLPFTAFTFKWENIEQKDRSVLFPRNAFSLTLTRNTLDVSAQEEL